MRLCSTVIFGNQSSILLILCIPQTLISLFRVISALPSSILLFLYIPQTLFSFSTVTFAHRSFILFFLYIPVTLSSLSIIFEHLTSTPLFLCIPKPLLTLVRVIDPNLSSTLLFLYILQTLFSMYDLVYILNSHFCASKLHFSFLCISETLFLLLRNISTDLSSICAFYGFDRTLSHSQQSLLRIQPPFCSFMHSKGLVLIFNCHYYTFNLHYALFIHFRDLSIILNSIRPGLFSRSPGPRGGSEAQILNVKVNINQLK